MLPPIRKAVRSATRANATALKLAVARVKEQWPQIQLDYDPVLLRIRLTKHICELV